MSLSSQANGAPAQSAINNAVFSECQAGDHIQTLSSTPNYVAGGESGAYGNGSIEGGEEKIEREGERDRQESERRDTEGGIMRPRAPFLRGRGGGGGENTARYRSVPYLGEIYSMD